MMRCPRWLTLLPWLLVAACATTRPPAAELPSPATPELPENVARALVIASAKAAAGDLAGALPYYRFAHESDPSDVHLALRAAEIAVELGMAQDALHIVSRTAEFHPQDLELGRLRLNLLLATGALAQADSLSLQLLESEPDATLALELRASVLERVGDPLQALAIYEQLETSAGSNAARLERMAYLALRAGNSEGASGYARRALQLDPSSTGALELLAASLADPTGLEAELKQLLEQTPESVVLRSALADLLLARGGAEEAVELLRPMNERGELERGARLVLSELLMRLGHEEEAQAIVDALSGEAPAEAAVRRLAGELAQRRGEFDLAAEHLEAALSAAPDDIESNLVWLLVEAQRYPAVFDANSAGDERRNQFNRRLTRTAALTEEPNLRHDYLVGTLMRRALRYGEAVQRLERAHQQDEESDQILYDLAVCFEELDRATETRATLEKLLGVSPDVPHYLNFFGYFLAERGEELDRAEAMIRRALEAEPQNAYYLDSLGWVQFQRGEFEAAHLTLQEAQANGLPEDPTVLEHVAETLLALGRLDEALVEFQHAVAMQGDRERLNGRIEEVEKRLRAKP